jgi:hypothetical protein
VTQLSPRGNNEHQATGKLTATPVWRRHQEPGIQATCRYPNKANPKLQERLPCFSANVLSQSIK